MCVDYQQLKEAFGLELEMEVVIDTEVLDAESDKPDINTDDMPQGELPFNGWVELRMFLKKQFTTKVPTQMPQKYRLKYRKNTD